MKDFGTIARGVKLPIIRENDNLLDIIYDSLFVAANNNNVEFKNKDVICITESLVARASGNYVTVDDIANDIISKFGEDQVIGVLWPIYSRNRFSMILKGIARAAKRVVVQLHNGKDEMGNDLENEWTGVDVVDFYREIIKEEGADPVIMLSDNISDIVPASNGNIIIATIHDREYDKTRLKNQIIAGSDRMKLYADRFILCTLEDICSKPRESGCGYNAEFGLLGSNKATEDSLKLFPRREECEILCEALKKKLKIYQDVDVEVMVYGDGCFKDPKAGIWEFADPVTSPYYTKGLDGCPNEVKMKYMIDTNKDIEEEIHNKDKNLVGNMSAQGTTPRRYYDLLASLADLTSGSGDKGTPVVWIQNYFNNYIS